MSVVWTESSHGIDWRLELERDRLLPGRLVSGRVWLTAHGAFEAQRLLVTLLGTEHWQHEVTETDAQGHTRTRVVTSRAEVAREPVAVLDAVRLADGETREAAFQLPVPPLGPATLEANVAGVTWILEAKLDVPGGFDSRLERPVRVLQPTALLRAGVVPVGQFALYGGADVAEDGVTGSVELDPVPLACGEAFRGRILLHAPGRTELQEIRAELRVRVESTVGGGRQEDITAWAAVLVPTGILEGDRTIEFEGLLPDRALPTIELPHGRTAAGLHVILARPWAPDTRLVRDVAMATTTEL